MDTSTGTATVTNTVTITIMITIMVTVAVMFVVAVTIAVMVIDSRSSSYIYTLEHHHLPTSLSAPPRTSPLHTP